MKTTKSQQSKLTPLQSETVKIITKFYKKNGYAVSQIWLCKHFNVGRSAMMERVNTLKNKGVIRKTPDGHCYPLA